jgi:uncharacterized protein (UPF0333 family)
MRRLVFHLGISQKGSAMLELAVAFPILLLIAIGVADYARVYYTGISVANAAKAGAHYGVWNAGQTGQLDSMTVAAQRDAGNTGLDSVTVGRYCMCPGAGVVDCVSGDCGAYGVPQVFDSVRVWKDVTMLIHYLGLPSRVTVAHTEVLREQ